MPMPVREPVSSRAQSQAGALLSSCPSWELEQQGPPMPLPSPHTPYGQGC